MRNNQSIKLRKSRLGHSCIIPETERVVSIFHTQLIFHDEFVIIKLDKERKWL